MISDELRSRREAVVRDHMESENAQQWATFPCSRLKIPCSRAKVPCSAIKIPCYDA